MVWPGFFFLFLPLRFQRTVLESSLAIILSFGVLRGCDNHGFV